MARSALSDVSRLLFYEEKPAKLWSNGDTQLVALIATHVGYFPVRSIIRRLTLAVGLPPDGQHEDCIDPIVLASAYIENTDRGVLLRNLASKHNHAPTLVAAVIQMAFDDNLVGAFLSDKPSEILEDPKDMWRRFLEEYPGQIKGSQIWNTHQEWWLNQMCSTTGRQELLDLAGLRRRYAHQYGSERSELSRVHLRELVFDDAFASVTAHTRK
jgi:hypothetical protein